MSRILIVAPDVPYPPFHGGRAATWEHAKALVSLGHEVDLLATVKADVPAADLAEMQAVFGKVWIVARTASPLDALRLESYQVATRRGLERVEINQKYDTLLMETPYGISALKNKTIAYDRLYFRVENDESVYFGNLSRSSRNVITKIFYRLESMRIGAAQDWCLEHADKALFISKDEMAGPMGRATKVPLLVGHGIAPTPPITRPLSSQTVTFIGSLFMRNNQAAIDWYLGQVHPLLIGRQDYLFLIAGRAEADIAESLRARWQGPKVEILISPVSLDDVYDRTRVFANPSQDSAGVKVKTIEAMRNGVPVVSTVEGAAGIDLAAGRDLLVAQSAEEFAAHVSKLLDDREECERLVERARAFILREADMAKNLEAAYGRVGAQ